MNKAVFLDRDGVINQAVVRGGKPYPPQGISELVVPRECPALLNRLKACGYLLFVVTNQPDVSRGTQSKYEVETINSYLKTILPIDEFFVCYHDDSDGCVCRKPQPGLILNAAKIYDVDVKNSFMIGDRWRDIEAGTHAGCHTIYIDYGYLERRPDYSDFCVGGLRDAVSMILSTDAILAEKI